MASRASTTRTANAVSSATGSGNLIQESGLAKDEILRLYYYMKLMREFEDMILRMYNQGKIVGGAYSGNGNEATAVGSSYALAKGDYIFPMHRDLGAHFVRGQSVLKMMLQHLGRGNGPTRGRDGTGHYTDPALRIYGNVSPLGAMVPVACGVALASKMRKEKSVVLTYIGDGGSSVGEVHEGLTMASAMRLPLILVIENNQYAYSTPISKQFIVGKLSSRAAGYGISGVTVDGTDVLEVYRACREAAARARKGDGPSIVETITMRMHGHAAHDNAWYVPAKMLEEWKKKDPVERFERLLSSQGVLSESSKAQLVKKIQSEVEDAAKKAEASPFAPGEDALNDVYAE